MGADVDAVLFGPSDDRCATTVSNGEVAQTLNDGMLEDGETDEGQRPRLF